jgi:hypothetical protein
LTDDIALLLEKLALENRHAVSPGWAPRTLASGGIPYATIFDVFQNMYESQVSGSLFVLFHDVANIRIFSLRFHPSMFKKQYNSYLQTSLF